MVVNLVEIEVMHIVVGWYLRYVVLSTGGKYVEGDETSVEASCVPLGRSNEVVAFVHKRSTTATLRKHPINR